jgi:hypothetical protein
MFGAEISNLHCEGDGSWLAMLIHQPVRSNSNTFGFCGDDARPSETPTIRAMTPTIKMLIGDWHIDELGILTREITGRD